MSVQIVTYVAKGETRYKARMDDKSLCSSNTKEGLVKLLKDKHNISYSFDGGVAVNGVTVNHAVKKSEFTVKERFEFIEQFTKLTARGVIPSMVVTGSGGLGKTHTVLQTLLKMGLQEDTIGTIDGDFVFIKGYTTPRNLYTTLYENNGKVIVLDDLDTAFRDPVGASILKAALDSSEKRIVSWGAESRDDTIPSRFEFYGKVIFISNLEMTKFPQAILSRSMLVDLTLSMEEKIQRIEEIFAAETNYDMSDKVVVLTFLKEHAAQAKDLNIRSAFNVLKIKTAIGNGWEKPALYNFSMN